MRALCWVLSALGIAGCGNPADPPSDPMGLTSFQARTAPRRFVPGRSVLHFNAELGHLDEESQRAKIAELQGELLGVLESGADYDPDSLSRFKSVPMLGIDLTASGASRLNELELQGIAGALNWTDSKIWPSTDTGDQVPPLDLLPSGEVEEHGLVSSAFPAYLDTSRIVINAAHAYSKGITGRDVTIVVIDSGVHDEGSPLEGKLIDGGFVVPNPERCTHTSSGSPTMANACFGDASYGRIRCPGDPDHPNACLLSHGTGVAYAACSLQGIAEGADLVSIRVRGRDGRSRFEDIVRALDLFYTDWRTLHPRSVVCISLGLKGFDASLNPCGKNKYGMEFARLAEKLAAVNIPVVVSAGNNAGLSRVALPGCVEQVLTVGASRKNLGPWLGERLAASSWSESIDVAAPGEDMSVQLDRTVSPGSHSSVAAPLAAGTLALLMQAYPKCSADQWVRAVKSSRYFADDKVSRVDVRLLRVDEAFRYMDLVCPH